MNIKFEKYGLSPEALEEMKRHNLKLDKRTMRDMINAYQTDNVTQEIIDDFETKSQISLPEDYTEFLLKYNGGKPSKTRIKGKVVNHFLALKSAYKYNSIVDLYQEFSAWGLPIATSPSGDYFLLHTNGKIYYYDHNIGKIDTANNAFAEGFTDFLTQLK